MKPPLPIKNGVAPSYLWLQKGPWVSMLDFLIHHFPHISASTWQTRMQQGEVVTHTGEQLKAHDPYRWNTCIFYYRELYNEVRITDDFTILHHDDHLLVVDKPHFMTVSPVGQFLHETLQVKLRKQWDLPNLTPIHRLDRETAGVILFSHNINSRSTYQGLFKQRLIHKIYEAIAPLLPNQTYPFVYQSCITKGEPFFRMQQTNDTPNAITHIDLIGQQNQYGHYQLRPITGRQHQLRVHMAALGIPIINDHLYPDFVPRKADDLSNPLQLLARQISFIDPISHQLQSFESKQILLLTPHKKD